MCSLSTAVVKAIEAGRGHGRYNLSGQDLQEIPAQVYDADIPLPAVKGSKQATGEGEWWGWEEVKKIDASRNRLLTVPGELTRLTSLTALDVSHNQLEMLPSGLGSLFQLASLAANNNTLQSLPPLPHSLVLLSVQRNRLQALPPSLARCSELTKLDCAHNMLTILPEEAMQGLKGLTELDCSCNQIQTLPAGIGFLTNLKVLHLVHNKLASLPNSIGNCRSLMELHAGQNSLREIPRVLGQCTSLRHLSLRDNRIQEVPIELCRLQLYVLDLQSCDLSTLPPQLGLMTSLKSLLLEGNALRTIRRPLITGPVSGLLRFLASRIPEDEGAVPASTPAQSGNIFGQDAASLAADMAHKLAIAGSSGSSDPRTTVPHYSPAPVPVAYDGRSWQQQEHPGSYGQPQQAHSSQQAHWNAAQRAHHSPYHAPFAHGHWQQQQQQQHSSYTSHPGSFGHGHGLDPAQPYIQGTHSSQWPGVGLHRPAYSHTALPSRQELTAGQQHGYGLAIEAAAKGHAAAPYDPRFQATADPHQPCMASQPQSYKAAHSTAPFATEATPALPPPKMTVGKTSLPKSELLLGGMGLRIAPDEVWEAAQGLSKLDLSVNQITYLPLEGMAQCTQLRTLLLSRAGLQHWPLPPPPGSLPQLRELDLSGNRGLALIPPGGLAACPGLVSLNLSGVPGAGCLPAGCLSALSGLQSLDLSFTGTSAFPFRELLPLAGTLRTLNLTSNRISCLPAEVAGLTRLEELHLSNNELASLPPQLGILTGSLRSLTLDGNPLRSIRRPIIERGTAAVLEYLKERIPA